MSESLPDLMRRLTLGVYVIGVCEGGRPNAFTACSVMPVCREHDKLAGVAWCASPKGAPLLVDALASLVCEVQGGPIAAGDHELFVARVTSGTLQAEHASALSYADTADMDGSTNLYAQRRIPDALGTRRTGNT